MKKENLLRHLRRAISNCRRAVQIANEHPSHIPPVASLKQQVHNVLLDDVKVVRGAISLDRVCSAYYHLGAFEYCSSCGEAEAVLSYLLSTLDEALEEAKEG